MRGGFNQLTLTNAANSGAQIVSVSRDQGTDPCTVVNDAVYPAASPLNKTINGQDLTFTPEVDSTATAFTSYGTETVVFSTTGPRPALPRKANYRRIRRPPSS
jgi:hypothetical protein